MVDLIINGPYRTYDPAYGPCKCFIVTNLSGDDESTYYKEIIKGLKEYLRKLEGEK